MTRIIYTDHEGTQRVVDVKPGHSVMEGAVRNGIPGIDADCGGACACATCHVYIDEARISEINEASEMEKTMLEFAGNVKSNSRLACQIIINDHLEGLIVQTPKSQQ